MKSATRWQKEEVGCMKEQKTTINKIKDKRENLSVLGQGCWDDCKRWKNNSSAPKCEYVVDAYNNIFL